MAYHCSQHVSESGVLEIFARGIRNPGLWNPEYSSGKSGIPQAIGIRSPISADKESNPVPVIWNPRRGIQTFHQRLSWISLDGLTIE